MLDPLYMPGAIRMEKKQGNPASGLADIHGIVIPLKKAYPMGEKKIF